MSDFRFDGTIIYEAYWNDKSSTVTIPSKATAIFDGSSDNYAFQQFKDKEFKVIFAESSQLTTIGSYSFYSCTKLLSIDFSNADKLTTINNNAFNGCKSLTSVKFPVSLTTINTYGAFMLCSSLTEAIFPAGSKLLTLGAGTFNSAPLKSFTFPKGCKLHNTIAEAFAGTQIEAFEVEDDDGDEIEIYKGSVYNIGCTALYIYHKGTEFELHPQVKNLVYATFTSSKCQHVILPQRLTNWGSLTFLDSLVEKVTMLSTPTSLGDRYFYNCRNLKELVLCEGLTSITYSSLPFLSTWGRLRSVYLPYSLTSINYKSIYEKDWEACFYGNLEVIKTVLANQNNLKVRECSIGIQISCNPQKSKITTKLVSDFLFIIICLNFQTNNRKQ